MQGTLCRWPLEASEDIDPALKEPWFHYLYSLAYPTNVFVNRLLISVFINFDGIKALNNKIIESERSMQMRRVRTDLSMGG